MSSMEALKNGQMFYVMHKLPYLSGIPNILSHTETPSIFANSVPSSFQLEPKLSIVLGAGPHRFSA